MHADYGRRDADLCEAGLSNAMGSPIYSFPPFRSVVLTLLYGGCGR